MNFTEEQKQEIFRRLSEGEGKKRIADIIGTTEWQIRKVFKEFSDQLMEEVERKGPRKIFEQIKTDTQTPSLKVISPNGKMTVAVASDIHFPFEDKAAVDIFLQAMKDLQPDSVVLLGDIIDCYEVSKYSKNPLREHNLKYELDQTKKFLRELRKIVPDSNIYFLRGNHEDRDMKYLTQNAPELACLEELKMENLLHLRDFGIEYVFGDLKIGDLVYTHGRRVSKHSGYTAKNNLDSMGISLITGHIHRAGLHCRTTWEKEYLAIENPTMASRSQSYLGGDVPNWQVGFSVINYDCDLFWPEIILIRDDKSSFRGKLYKGTNWEK